MGNCSLSIVIAKSGRMATSGIVNAKKSHVTGPTLSFTEVDEVDAGDPGKGGPKKIKSNIRPSIKEECL